MKWRCAMWWTKGAQTKRWIKWVKFTIGFKDDEMINNPKVTDKGNLVCFSDNEPTIAWWCRSARQGWRFLTRNWRKGGISHKGYFVQSRDGNFDHIMRSEGRWEQSTQKACGHRGEPICAFARWMDIILWKNSWCQLTWSRGRLFNHNDKTRIAIDFWSIVESSDVRLYQQHLEMTLLVLTSDLTWPRAAVRKYKTDTIVAGFWPWVEYQRYRRLPSVSHGYSHTFIQQMVQEICFIEVDKCCWNSMLADWSELTNSNFDQDSKGNLRKLWIPSAQISISYFQRIFVHLALINGSTTMTIAKQNQAEH
jgi:hypothetical protein